MPDLPSSRTGSHQTSSSNNQPGKPSFLAPFLGAFAAVILLSLVGGAAWFGYTIVHDSKSAAKTALKDTTKWQKGQDQAQPIDANTPAEKADVGWWASTFNVPATADVIEFLKKDGLAIDQIEALHYQDTADGALLTYEVHAHVPSELLYLSQATWQPQNPDEARFARILILNQGLPAGVYWDTSNAQVAAAAGTKLNFKWNVHWIKQSNEVVTDRLPFTANVYSPQEVTSYQTEAGQSVANLDAHIQQIDAKVQADTAAYLAQVPPDPPKPQKLTAKFGGDGSGEPTKSAARIGGGAAAGAAGGAAFGAAAGNAGMGAGIGAGVGLLGGIIYDAVSKDNDKKKQQRAVADANAERLDEWKSEVRSLANQRAAIKKGAVQEREDLLNQLASQITANGGVLPPLQQQPPPNNAPQGYPAQQPMPGPQQPSGPIRQ